MPALDDLVRVTNEGGPFSGYTLRRLLVLIGALSRHDNMRNTADGARTNRTQHNLLERRFREDNDLSASQYRSLVDLYNGSELEGLYAAMLGSLPASSPTAQTAIVMRHFAPDVGPRCCGRYMTVRELTACAHTLGESFAAKHVTKHCVGHCGSTYYLNKKTRIETLGHGQVTTHTFYPWNNGEPEWVASKSGKTVLSASLLTSFAMSQCTMR